MLLLGCGVGRGPIAVDTWFQQLGDAMGWPGEAFLAFSNPLALTVALAIGVVVAVRQHRNRLALAMVAAPLVAIAIVRVVKPVFGREKEGALAYPSGHTTFLVTVVGLLVVVAGAGLWAVVVAVGFCLLGMFGQAISYHYFTDTVGAALLGTSVVCAVVALTRGERSIPVESAEPGRR